MRKIFTDLFHLVNLVCQSGEFSPLLNMLLAYDTIQVASLPIKELPHVLKLYLGVLL
jgi:hypothetical protein